jgi:hypothetical protein
MPMQEGRRSAGGGPGSMAPFVRMMLPVLDRCRSGRHGLQVDYWAAFLVACPCCAETRPVRWCDAWHGDYGQCQACGLGRVPAWRAAGPRCPVHRRWDAEHAPAQPVGRLPVEGRS